MDKKFNRIVFSSLKTDYKTPENLYKKLDKEFKFNFDPCPLNPKFDGLNIEWGTSNFVNPPYSQIDEWIKKGYSEWLKNKTVIFLIPSRTDTKYFHNYCLKANEIRFIEGRLKFSNYKNSAPFPSCIIIFRGLKC